MLLKLLVLVSTLSFGKCSMNNLPKMIIEKSCDCKNPAVDKTCDITLMVPSLTTMLVLVSNLSFGKCSMKNLPKIVIEYSRCKRIDCVTGLGITPNGILAPLLDGVNPASFLMPPIVTVGTYRPRL